MNLARKYISILLVLCSVSISAQTLPTLKKASSITVGTLQNGASYYLVANTAAKGYADFCLVQKDYMNPEASRKALCSLDNFPGTQPYRFLASKGVGYSKEGFISTKDGSTLFNFRDVPMFDSAAADSTLLIIFDMMRHCPANQAVIISGDIKASTIIDRMHMLSLTVNRLPAAGPESPYSWNPSETPVFKTSANGFRKLSEITIEFSSPRTPRELLSTTQPLVTKMFASGISYTLKKRLGEDFRKAGIAVSNIRFTYRSSGDGAGDERYKLSLDVDSAFSQKAVSIVAESLARLDTKGATTAEYSYIKNRIVAGAQRKSAKPQVPNASFVRQCVSSYLYGASLAAEETVNEFLSVRRLPAEQEVRLFNNFVSALLDPQRAISVHLSTPGKASDTNDLSDNFRASWIKATADTVAREFRSHKADTAVLVNPRSKVRLKTDAADPITGGRIWTFSNGIRVVFKKIDTPSQFTYAFMMRGSCSSIQSLTPGENAYVGDALLNCRIGGLSPVEFKSMLTENGIKMKCTASLSDLRITGSAPSNELSLLMRSVVTMAKDRKADNTEYDYFLRCESLKNERRRHSPDGVTALADSLRRPSYLYPEHKSDSGLSANLPQRSEKYFDARFSNMADGVIVLVGDLDETATQKALCKVLGGFSTAKGFAARPKVQNAWREGWHTLALDGHNSGTGNGTPIVNVCLSSKTAFTMDSYMGFEVAKVALRRAIVDAVAPYGISVEITDKVELYPVEQFILHISCRPCSPDAVGTDVRFLSQEKILNIVRQAIVKAGKTKVSEAALAGYKEELSDRMESSFGNPEHLVNDALVRYSMGKDIVTGYKNHIKTVTAENVMDILRGLDGDSKVEIILR